MISGENLAGPEHLPGWVPADAARYIAHVEHGASLRALARESGCHASTVLRQVRRIEQRRDDPLIDAALRDLAARQARGAHLRAVRDPAPERKSVTGSGARDAGCTAEPEASPGGDAALARAASGILRLLCQRGAVLAVAQDMDKSVIVRTTATGDSERLAVVDSALAQAIALKGWISCDEPGRVSRYRVTTQGRAALGRMTAAREDEARLRAEGTGEEGGTGPRQVQPETPMAALARRRDKTGRPFLAADLVMAGERLRTDYELAQLCEGPRTDWRRFLAEGAADPAIFGDPALSGPAAARRRIGEALRDLGPGLGDVALRCCCELEGLEATERRMGWSARSGKIVLRIALQRLRRHYAMPGAGGQRLIG